MSEDNQAHEEASHVQRLENQRQAREESREVGRGGD